MSDWLTYNPTSGYGNGTITITAQTLSELNGRVDTLIASGINTSISATTEVTQYGTPTSITFDSLSVVWVNDVPWYGGIASKSNCNYIVYANYSDGTQLDVTNATEVTGELEVPPTTATTRQNVGTLSLTATFRGETTNVSVTAYQSAKNHSNQELTFNIISGGTIVWKATDSSIEKTISYSKNGSNWIEITSTKEGTSINVSNGDIVKFKGNNNAYGNGRYSNTFSGSTAKFYIEGNIMSLIDGTNYTNITSISDDAFSLLFYRCSGLTSAENLILPATTLTPNCYRSMFADCTSLTTAPLLSASTLAEWCYAQMFEGCTSLTINQSVLPAATLEKWCYYNMFQGCTSLTTAPALPATMLAPYCYAQMFEGCSSLISAPALSATTLAPYCYAKMFTECTSLTSAPALPATTLAFRCYQEMFYRCKSLTSAPALPATTLAEGCYANMFTECTSLTSAPALPATTLAFRCYAVMFVDCTSLTTAPELPATILVYGCYDEMFRGCSSLNYIKCLATDISAERCTFAWVGDVASTGTFVKNPSMTSWTTGDNGIPSGWTVQNA